MKLLIQCIQKCCKTISIDIKPWGMSLSQGRMTCLPHFNDYSKDKLSLCYQIVENCIMGVEYDTGKKYYYIPMCANVNDKLEWLCFGKFEKEKIRQIIERNATILQGIKAICNLIGDLI